VTITEQLDMAFPDVPGFKGQGWSTQETAMVVRWLFGDPAAWDQAMSTARAYPGNPHTVADTLHEQIVPRPELDAIVTAGGDPARVDWLEIAHELIERRDDPRPAVMLTWEILRDDPGALGGIAAARDAIARGDAVRGVAAVWSLAAQAAADTPDDPAMATACHLHDTGRHLASASGHLDAAREAPAGDPDDHIGRCAASLDGAHASAHHLAAHLRSHYPREGSDLDALCTTIGLAVSVSDQAKTATTGHLVQTICNHLGHTIEHTKAMQDDPDPKVRSFNADHARTHLDGALEHVGKLTRHLQSNYPAEAKHLAELAEPESISGQAARHAKVS
jgi:hypothetical protein